jgi:hypothetical protein
MMLPHEILGEIFVESCPLPQDNSITDMKGTRSMVLASVCESWRNVALSTPELWSKFQYCPNTHQDMNCLVPLKLHLDRSGSFPLTFIVKPTQHEPGDEHWHFLLFDLIFRHAHHWGDATILFSYNLIYQALEGVSGFPVLHTFRAFELTYPIAIPFLRAPNLRHLEFTNSHVPSS